MNKVIIEITSKDYEINLFLNGKKFRQKHERTSFGADLVEGTDIDDIPEKYLTDELYQALNSFFSYDVMESLYKKEMEEKYERDN